MTASDFFLGSQFGYTHPERDKREMCPVCKNEDTQRITAAFDLAPFAEHYRSRPFVAFSCFACGGTFHFERTAEGDAREAMRKANP